MASTELQPAIEVIDALPLAVVLLDADGTISGWNGAAEVLYGHRPDDVVGRRAIDVLFDSDDHVAAGELIARVAAGERWEGDFRVRRSDGMRLVSSFAHSSRTRWMACRERLLDPAT